MVSGLPFYGQPDIFFILLKATVPYTLGDISVDTNMYYPLGTYLSDSTYCGELLQGSDIPSRPYA